MATQAMKWDVVFYVSALPAEYRFCDEHFFMATADVEHVSQLRDATKEFRDIGWFFGRHNQAMLTAVGLRVDADNEGDAINNAHRQLSGFIDGLSVLLDHSLPEVCPLVLVGQSGDREAQLMQILPPTWAYFQTADPNVKSAWEQRCKSVLGMLLPFFDIAARVHPRGETSLARQIAYSMKMYRHGAQTRVYGLEFICKWCALEGLVCGGERPKKQLLLERLLQLFPGHEHITSQKITELWTLRNDAVHEARAFELEPGGKTPTLGLFIDRVDLVYLAVVSFAISHLQDCDTVASLWSRAPTHTLPAFVSEKRPPEIGRMVVTSARLKLDLVLRGAGTMFAKTINSVRISGANPGKSA